jgi:septum formation protein
MTSSADSPDGQALRVVLASSSPRRRAILRMLGVDVVVVEPHGVEQAYMPPGDPADYALGQARAKLGRAAASEPEALVVAGDTIVVLDGVVLGKPEHPAHAREMLRALSGRSHDVITAVGVGWRRRERSGFERTRVTFRHLEDGEIADYVECGEPLDKAGAYGIQGRGAFLVRRIDGCYFNVMGLPVARLLELVAELGLRYDPQNGRFDRERADHGLSR